MLEERFCDTTLTTLITVVTAYGIRHYSSLTLPLNPPPQVGDFGRYAPGEEMGVTTLQHYRGVMSVMVR